MLERFKNRADSEHEQALIRFMVGLPLVIYFIAAIGWQNLKSGVNAPLFGTIVFFILGAIFIFAWLLLHPQVCPPRRFAGMLLDLGCTSSALYFKGELAAPVFVVYLWVTFGNGFRYGKRYLIASTVLSIIGFGVASEMGEFRGVADQIRYGLMVGLLILPLYVNSFLSRLNIALERAKAGERAKAHFLANVSHEIRTPLTAMLGLSEQLLDAPLGKLERRYVEMIHDSSQNLLEILNAILDFSKLQNNKVILVEEDFLLRDVLDSLVEVLSAGLGDKGPKLKLAVAGQAPLAIRCDRVRLLEVLNNLLRNAVKFTPEGQVLLTVEPAPGKAEGWLRFLVSDTGIGINHEAATKLFEPFSQADDSTSRRYGGTGLGLAISRELVKAMGGEISLESEEGIGTRIWVDLPVTAVDSKALIAVRMTGADQPEKLPVWSKQPHILVVEDNEYNRELLKAILERYGCRVLLADDGEKAVEAIRVSREDPFDLVFMDCHMPNLDGYETTAMIRATDLGNRFPIIALTANIEPDNRAKCMAAGMTDFLAKPYNRRDLLQVLMTWIEAKNGIVSSGENFRAVTKTSGKESARPSLIHDINNQVNVITGYAETLSMNAENEELRQKYKRILQAGERIAELVRKIPA